jgi:putative transposase
VPALSKTDNASGVRRSLDPIAITEPPPPTKGIAPLLAKLLAEQAATGLPPAYLPKDEKNQGDEP